MNTFSEYISEEFQSFCDLVLANGFKVAVVGGSVRDYYLGYESSHDFDCELRPLRSDSDFHLHFIELIETLSEHYAIDSLAYGVYRIFLEHSECEITLPRKEVFKDFFHHSNFDVKFIQDIDHSQGVLRRDFTINAMMYEYTGQWTFIDPLGGRADLEQRKLVVCSDTFYLDPVRFLRALRFHILYNMKIDIRIINAFKSVSLDDLSAFYIRQEAQKSFKPLTFLLLLLKLSKEGRESSYTELIYEFEKNHYDSDLKNVLTSHLYLEKTVFKDLTLILNYSIKDVLIEENFYFKSIIKLSFERFVEGAQSSLAINIYKKLLKLQRVYIDYMFENKIIDIDYNGLRQLEKIEIDLSAYENTQRKFAQFYFKLRTYFEG